MRQIATPVLLALLTTVFVAGACGGDDDTAKARAALAAGCALNSDCNDPLVCVFQRCHVQCNDSRDCQTGARCVRGDNGRNVCQLPDDVKCTTLTDCSGKQLCAPDGECRDSCAGVGECVTMQSCANQGVCAEASEVDPMGNLRGGGKGGAGGSSAGGAGGTTQAGQGGTTAGGQAGTGTGGSAGSVSTGGAGGGCPVGFDDCGGPTGSCGVSVTTLTNCGTCGNACTGANTTMNLCEAGTCKIAGCKSGFGDCDNDPKTGCEAPTDKDAKNCGACARDCLGGACATGLCGGVVVAQFTGNQFAHAVATDTHVFGVQAGLNPVKIMRFDMEPSASSVEGKIIHVVGGSSSPRLSVDGGFLYWAERGNPSVAFRRPADGSDDPALPFFNMDAGVQPEKFVATTAAFYWLDPFKRSIYTHAKDGTGADTVLLTRPAGTNLSNLAVGASHLVWTENMGSGPLNLWRATIDGQNPEQIDSDVGLEAGLALTPTDLFYTNVKSSPNGAVKRQAWADPIAPKTIASVNLPASIHPDDGSFLLHLKTGNTVVRMQPDGKYVPIGASMMFGLGTLFVPTSKYVIYNTSNGVGPLSRMAK